MCPNSAEGSVRLLANVFGVRSITNKGGKTWTVESAADETELPGEEDTAVGKER